MTKVEIDTTDFESSHGTTPRGRGGWLFATVDPRRSDYLDHLQNFNGTYQDAKLQATFWAKANRVPILYVCA